MTWLGPVSAWAAVIVGALLLGVAALHFSWGVVNWWVLLASALLLVGGFRTIRALSGGLRLLGGAWGVLAGLTATPLARPEAPSSYTVDLGLLSVVLVAAPWIALTGLALTVLHKEQKNPAASQKGAA